MVKAEFRCVYGDGQNIWSEMEWNDGRLDSHRMKMILEECHYQAKKMSVLLDAPCSCWLECNGRIAGNIYTHFTFKDKNSGCAEGNYNFYQVIDVVTNVDINKSENSFVNAFKIN